MLELVHVHKSFGNVTPLYDVSVTINEGDVVSLIGPSGCGKTTLLRCVNLLDPPTSGSIILDGEDIIAAGYDASTIGARMGMVFQKFNLFRHWTVLENIMNPQIEILHRTRQEAYDTAMPLLREVGLADKAFSFPEELSGGQQQRVAICRTLAMDPEIILFDEPTSALDPTKVGEVEEVIKSLASQGRTMMIVTHEMRFAREVANRVFYLDEGGIYEDGTPDAIFNNPQKEKTRRFVQRLRSLSIEIESRDFDYPAAIAEITAYSMRCHIPYRTMQRAMLLLEELCCTLLMPELPAGNEKISFMLDWSEVNFTLSATIKCNGKGPSFDELVKELELVNASQIAAAKLEAAQTAATQLDPSARVAEIKKLSLSIVKGSVETIAYRAIDEKPYTSRFDIVFL